MRKPVPKTRRENISPSRRLTNLNEGDMNSKSRRIDNHGLYITIQCHLFSVTYLMSSSRWPWHNLVDFESLLRFSL